MNSFVKVSEMYRKKFSSDLKETMYEKEMLSNQRYELQ